MIDLQIFDSRHVWHWPMIDAARRRGWKAKRIKSAPTEPSPFGFIRPHPGHMAEHIALDSAMRQHCRVMVQDRAQVISYDNKIEQIGMLSGFMPKTWLVTDVDDAVNNPPTFPVVSKAAEGASSVNVRVINTAAEYHDHVRQVFSPEGIKVNRCADGMMTHQQGYLYLQEFIPHDRTYRVNIVGNRAAVFERYNYADRPVAQTGNTKGIHEPRPELLDYAFDVAREIGSKWVALDILRRPESGEFVLLETSLAWPWSPNEYADTPFINTNGEKAGTWGSLWDVLYDQLESGVFGSI